MATNMGRGIVAPDTNDNISSTGVSEMRTIASTAAAAITDVDVRVAQKLDKTEAYDNLVPRDEAVQYGIRGLPGKDGEPGPPGIPAAGAVPEDTAVSAFLAAEHSQTGALARDMFAGRDTTATASADTTEYWVATWGDDTTGDGTEGNPYKSINHAARQLPDMIRSNHHHHIILLPGDYPEDVRIANKVAYGRITIGGQTNERARYSVRTALVDRVFGQLQIENLMSTVNDVEGARSFEVRASGPHIVASNIAVTPDQGGPLLETRGFLADYGSTVRITGSDFSGKRYGVRSNYQSQIYLTSSNTGSGNDIGVAARWGAKLSAHYGGLPTGNTPMSTNSGGIITLGHGGIVGDLDEAGLVDHTSYRDQGSTSKTWLASRDTIPSNWIADQDIPAGSTLRFRFRAPQNNVQYKINVEWLSRTGLVSAQSVETKTTIFMRGNEILHDQTDVVHSYSMPSNPVSLTARGSNLDFYIDITGVAARQGEWTAKISIDTSLGKVPILAAAELL